MKKLWLVVTPLLLVGCNNLLLSEDESSGVTDILDFYGGYCQYGIGASASTQEGSGAYFELGLSGAEAINNHKPELITSNMSYRFYKKLNVENRKKYKYVVGSVLLEDQQTIEHKYPVERLETVDRYLQMVDQISLLINEAKYDSLSDMLVEGSTFRYNKNDMIKNLERNDLRFGKINEFRLFGFNFFDRGNTKVLKITGVFIRELENCAFTIWVEPRSEKIAKIDYKQEWI